MENIIKHICSVKEICNECPFLKSNRDAEALSIRRHHLTEMKGDLFYRPNCRKHADVADGGDNPMCRGAAVYMHKTKQLNAALKVALDSGEIKEEELVAEHNKVI